jgi:hypothetical protein
VENIMGKSGRSKPEELKKFIKLFDSLAVKHSSHIVFSDFLDLFINGFSFNHNAKSINK